MIVLDPETGETLFEQRLDRFTLGWVADREFYTYELDSVGNPIVGIWRVDW